VQAAVVAVSSLIIFSLNSIGEKLFRCFTFCVDQSCKTSRDFRPELENASANPSPNLILDPLIGPENAQKLR